MEWSASNFDNYNLSTAEVIVSCTGSNGIANGTFRLSLDTTDHEYSAVQVSRAAFSFGSGQRKVISSTNTTPTAIAVRLRRDVQKDVGRKLTVEHVTMRSFLIWRCSDAGALCPYTKRTNYNTKRRASQVFSAHGWYFSKAKDLLYSIIICLLNC